MSKLSKLRRDELGRIQGSLIDPYWFHNDDGHWFDHKCSDVIFPSHTGNMNGEVVVTKLSDLK